MPHSEICGYLHQQIAAALPQATSKTWHSMPVWFLHDNPIVGYKATAKHVNLLFWSGQLFNEPSLQAAGKDKAAQIRFTDLSQIDPADLRRWLKKASTNIWDYTAQYRK